MQLRFDEKNGLVYLDGTAINLSVLIHMADPDKRVLWRFERQDCLIVARCYTEEQVVWTGEGQPADIVIGVKA